VTTGDRQPRHRAIRDALRAMIAGPDYAPGDRIPAERDLAARFGASRMTVRRAIDDLVRLGALERDSTNGTFVRRPVVTRPVGGPVRGLSQILRDADGSPTSRLEAFAVAPAGARIARRLGTTPGEPIIELRRLRLAGERPFCVETSYVPRVIAPELTADDLDGASLYRVLEERYGVVPHRADETIGLGRASPDEAASLGLEPGAPVLLLRAVVFDARDVPMEYLVSINHPDRVAFGVSGGEPVEPEERER
jgi:GntR family transcriptional regulator